MEELSKEEDSRSKRSRDESSEQDVTEEAKKNKDKHIIGDMATLRVVAELIYADSYSYAQFSCQNEQAQAVCESIKDYAGTFPAIHSSQEQYCAYVRLLSEENNKAKYSCITYTGALVETTDYPGKSGYCTETSFNCPED